MKHAVRIMVMAAMLLILAVPVEAATKTTRLSATSIAMDAGTKTKIKLVKYKKLSKKQLKKVKWTSSNKKVATVKASGKYKQNATITAKHSGKTTIRVIYNRKSYRCKVTVNQEGKKHQSGDVDDDDEEEKNSPEKKKEEVIAATSITINQGTEMTLTEGDTYQLTATVVPSNAPVIWNSSNPSVATVDQNGLVTVLKGGKVGISCISQNTSKPKIAIMSITANLKAKYTYECHLLADVYNDGFYPTGLYDDGETPIYIKTDNPNPETIEMQYVSGYDSNNYHNFADVKYNTEEDRWHALRRVEGGYLGLLSATGTYEKTVLGDYNYNEDKRPVGKLTSLIREYATADHSFSQPYAEAGSFTFEVKDYEKEKNAWMDRVIAEQTTPDMNVHEKMLAISKYIMTEFEYMPSIGDREGYGSGGGMAMTNLIGPFFKSYRVESEKGPEVLEDFGEKIGYLVYNGDDYLIGYKPGVIAHGYAVGTYNGVTYAYCGCPTTMSLYYFSKIEEHKTYDSGVGLHLYETFDEKHNPTELYKAEDNIWFGDIYNYRNIQFVDFSKFK